MVFVNFVQDGPDSPPQEDPPKQEDPKSEPPKSESQNETTDPAKGTEQTPPPQDGQDQNPPAGEVAKQDPPAGAEAAESKPPQEMNSDTTAEGATIAAPETGTQETAGDAQATGKEAKYRPLDDEARKTIREKLARTRARPLAQEKMTKAMDVVRSGVDRYGRELARSKALNDASPPTPLDFAALAQENGVSYHKTPLLDIVQMAEANRAEEVEGDPDYYQFARASEMSFDPRQGLVRRSILDSGFTGDLNPFTPRRLVDGFVSDDSFPTAPDAIYVYWRAEEVPEIVPELKDIREEVIATWKTQKAFPLALQAAQDKATTAGQQSGKSLAEVFPDLASQVISTNEFSWMTRGSMPSGAGARPTLSPVNGMQQGQPVNVPGAGREFMASVFGLQVEGIGTAPNQPKTIVYVVRMAGESLSYDQRREMFFASGMTAEVGALMQEDQVNVISQWYEDLDREYKVSWKRDPSRSWEL